MLEHKPFRYWTANNTGKTFFLSLASEMLQGLSPSRTKSVSTIINLLSGNVTPLDILNISTYIKKKKVDFIYIKTLGPAYNSSLSWMLLSQRKCYMYMALIYCYHHIMQMQRLKNFLTSSIFFTIRFNRHKISQAKCYRSFKSFHFIFSICVLI